MNNYLVIYEKSKQGYSAYVPDLPGCTTAGESKAEVQRNIKEAMRLYLTEHQFYSDTVLEDR